MVYQFTKDLETGNAAIDSEHRQLIQAINDLLSACSSGKGRGELEKTTQFLSEYTAKLQKSGERFMWALGKRGTDNYIGGAGEHSHWRMAGQSYQTGRHETSCTSQNQVRNCPALRAKEDGC